MKTDKNPLIRSVVFDDTVSSITVNKRVKCRKTFMSVYTDVAVDLFDRLYECTKTTYKLFNELRKLRDYRNNTAQIARLDGDNFYRAIAELERHDIAKRLNIAEAKRLSVVRDKGHTVILLNPHLIGCNDSLVIGIWNDLKSTPELG